MTVTTPISITAITICRELYDRFIMGGWEPQDAHQEVQWILDEYRRLQNDNVKKSPFHV